MDMDRIYRKLAENEDERYRVTELLRVGLPAIAKKLHEHTQKDGLLFLNDGPELRAKLSVSAVTTALALS